MGVDGSPVATLGVISAEGISSIDRRRSSAFIAMCLGTRPNQKMP